MYINPPSTLEHYNTCTYVYALICSRRPINTIVDMSIMEWFVLFSRNCGRLHHPAKLSQTSSKLILREGQGRGPGRDLGDRCLENILVINWISSLRLVALTLTTTKSKLLHNFRNFSDYCARAVLANNHTYRRWVGIGTITNDIHTYVAPRPWPPCKCRQNVTHCEWMESRCPRAFLWAGATKKEDNGRHRFVIKSIKWDP